MMQKFTLTRGKMTTRGLPEPTWNLILFCFGTVGEGAVGKTILNIFVDSVFAETDLLEREKKKSGSTRTK